MVEAFVFLAHATAVRPERVRRFDAIIIYCGRSIGNKPEFFETQERFQKGNVP